MFARLIGVPALLGVLAIPSPAPAPASALHLQLTKSAPAADAMVHEFSAIKLWFSEDPQENSVSVRLLDGQGDLVETGDVTKDTDEAALFSVSPANALKPGTYTVSWRAMGSDGHVVRGDFEFSYMAH